MIGWSAETEDSCLWSLYIPKFSILADLTLCFRKLVLWNSLVSNGSRLSLDLIDKALVVDLNRQHLRVLIRIERMLINELLLWGPWPLTVMVHLLILTCYAIFWSVALTREDSLLLRSVTASFNSNDHLSSLIVLLVNCIVSVHLDYLSDLDRWVTNVTILVVILLLQFVLMLAVIWTSKKGSWLRIGSLLVIRDSWSKRIAASLGTFLGATIWLLLRVMQSLASIATFSIHFLFMWEWVHSLTFYPWVLSSFCFVVLGLDSIRTE